jgi:hypothetical protein
MICERLLESGEPVVVAVDDSLFCRGSAPRCTPAPGTVM